MSTFTLRNTAAEIDSAISRVASADTEPKSNSANMVTSGGVKQYVDAINVGANSFLAPLVARINALSTPEILSFDNFQNYPLAHNQGSIIFSYNTTPISKGTQTVNVTVHAYDVNGNQVSTNANPVADVTLTANKNGSSGTFTGSFDTTFTGYLKLASNYEIGGNTFLTGKSQASFAIVSANPSLTNPLTI